MIRHYHFERAKLLVQTNGMSWLIINGYGRDINNKACEANDYDYDY